MYLVTGASGFWPRWAPRAKITPPTPRSRGVCSHHARNTLVVDAHPY